MLVSCPKINFFKSGKGQNCAFCYALTRRLARIEDEHVGAGEETAVLLDAVVRDGSALSIALGLRAGALADGKVALEVDLVAVLEAEHGVQSGVGHSQNLIVLELGNDSAGQRTTNKKN